MLNIPSDVSAKPLGKGKGQHWPAKMVGQKIANVFCQAIGPTCFPSILVPSFASKANRGWKDCNSTSFYRSRSPTRAGGYANYPTASMSLQGFQHEPAKRF